MIKKRTLKKPLNAEIKRQETLRLRFMGIKTIIGGLWYTIPDKQTSRRILEVCDSDGQYDARMYQPRCLENFPGRTGELKGRVTDACYLVYSGSQFGTAVYSSTTGRLSQAGQDMAIIGLKEFRRLGEPNELESIVTTTISLVPKN